jgi:uncharacterized membrane protein
LKIKDQQFIFLNKPALLQKKMLKKQAMLRTGKNVQVTRINLNKDAAISHENVIIDLSQDEAIELTRMEEKRHRNVLKKLLN